MPRRKKQIIPIKDLAISSEIIKELEQHPELADYDMDTLQITILKKHKTQIQNLDKVISNLKHYWAINEKHISIINGEVVIFKTDIIKMMKISRPTLDKWIKDGNITPQYSTFFKKHIFPPKLILEQLEAYKEENK